MSLVQSRLKLLLAQRNVERMQRGEMVLTIRDLAEAAELAPSVVSGLTARRANQVHFRTLAKLCKVLGCTPGDILEYVDERR